MMTWLRSIGAVFVGLVAGMLVVFALTYAAALVFFSGDLTVAPTPSYLVVNLAYSFAAAMLAGWLAAGLTLLGNQLVQAESHG